MGNKMINKDDAIKKIWRLAGDIKTSLALNNGSLNREELLSMGYSISKGCYGSEEISKEGLVFPIYYLCDCRYHLSNGFYFDKGVARTFCSFSNIPIFIDSIILLEKFNPKYERNEELQQLADGIYNEIMDTKTLVSKFNSWLLGNPLRYKGYFVDYDGYSVCTFTKNGIIYHATMIGNGKWKVDDNFSVYLANGIVSDNFGIEMLEKYPEFILGYVAKLGKRLTEMDLLPAYTKFRVRTYGDKTLETIKWFDDFESAKKYAYEYAVKQASKVEPRYRQWAHNPPLDWSKRNDYLACYVWYMHSENYPYLVFVQGEND